jgi:uncharacterized membrane protein YbhN (UPF0104 family)
LTSFLGRYGAYLWFAVIIGFTVSFGLSQKAEIFRIRDTILHAGSGWLVAMVGVEIAILLLVAGTYRSLLARLGHNIKLDTLIGVHLQRVVVGTVTPVGGPSSMAIFVHTLRQRGVLPADALLAVSIKSVIGNIAFLLLLVPVLFVQEPTPLLLAGTVGLVALVCVTAALLVLVLRSSKPPRWLLNRIPRKGLRFLAQVRRHEISMPSLAGPFLMMMTTKLAGIAMLFIALQAVGYNADVQVPMMAYLVGMVFLMVAPVFQGIGVVEVSMALALQRLGVPPAAAVGATLLTRAGELWLPLAAGVILQATDTIGRRFRTPAPQTAPLA